MIINGKTHSDASVVELIKGMEHRALRTFEREKRLIEYLDVIRAVGSKEVQLLVDQALETNHYLIRKDLGYTQESDKQ